MQEVQQRKLLDAVRTAQRSIELKASTDGASGEGKDEERADARAGDSRESPREQADGGDTRKDGGRRNGEILWKQKNEC